MRNDLGDCASHWVSASHDPLMGDLAVPGLALDEQGLDAAAWIRGCEHGATPVSAQALPEIGQTGLQKNDMTVLAHQAPTDRIDHRATPGGQYKPRGHDQLCDQRRLTLSEARFTLELKNGRDRDTATELEFDVGIDEAPAQDGRKPSTHGRLAGPHHAYKYQISHRQD